VLWAQQPVPVPDLHPDAAAVLQEAVALYDQQNLKGAQAALQRIRPNDSLYYHALYELCLVHLAREDYNSVRQTALLGLAQPNALHAGFLRHLASALDLLGQPDAAQVVFAQALARYPYDYQLYYSRGVTHAAHKNYTAAKADLRQALRLYPFHQPSHLALGVIYAEEGQVIPALMALALAVTFDPRTDRAELARQWLEHLLEIKYFELTAKTPQPENAGFVVLESDFLERIVYHSSYTGSKLEVPLPLLLQVELVANRVEPAAQDTGFAMQFYAPIFAWIRTQNLTDVFCYQLLQDAGEKVVDDILAKRSKDVVDFRAKLTQYLEAQHLFVAVTPPGGKAPERTQMLYGTDGHLLSIGNSTAAASGDAAVGYWQTFHPGGERASTGSYDAMGRRTGTWRYYAPEGYLSAEETYATGKLQGPVRSYYPSGQVQEAFTADNNQPQGPALGYYPTGVVRSRYVFANGQKQGPGAEFHPNGQTATTTLYAADTANGPLRVFSQTGRLLLAATMTKGKLNGAYTAYHPNGKVAEQGTYDNGKRKGPYKTFYPDGTLQRETQYVLDLPDGPDRHFAPNGSLTHVAMYAKGKRHGLQQEYDPDGHVRAELTFANDLLTAYRILAPDGKVLHTASDATGTLLYVVPTGLGPNALLQKGAYQFGARSGPWQNYYPNGALYEELTFQDDDLNGPYMRYAPGGQVLQRVAYKKGQAQGLQETFYADGKPATQGYMERDEPVGYWNRFYPDGRLAETAYYRNGQPYGWQHEWALDGTLRRAVQLDAYGLPSQIVQPKSVGGSQQPYDTLTITGGAVGYVWPHANGTPYLQGCYLDGLPTDTWATYYPNGRLESYRTYVAGQLQGRSQQFYPDGRPTLQGDYAADARTGLWQEFYPNGQLAAIGPYVNDLKQGQWVYFAPNGQRLRTEQYQGDLLEGEVQYFDGQGGPQPLARLFYTQGELMAYGYNAPTGDLVRLVLPGGTGPLRVQYPSGALALEATAVAGRLHGKLATFYPDGSPQTQAQYHYGALHGPFAAQYPDGSPQLQATYHHDQPHDTYRLYYPGGQPLAQYQYQHGVLHGGAQLWPSPAAPPTQVQYWHNAPMK